jgi:hypothetical protein
VVLRAGRPGGGRRSPLLVGKRARGWSEERRGARRRARVRGGRAAGGGCRSLGKLVAWRQMGSLNADPARADATLTRTRHAWVVCQHGGGLTGRAAGYISPSSRTCARRRRRWHGGTRWSRRELPTWEVVSEPLDRTHTESRGKRRTLSRPPYLEVRSSAGATPLDPTVCPPLFWPISAPAVPLWPLPWCARPAHGGSRGGWHAACPSTCPAPPRSRFGGADNELLEHAHHGTLGPSDSEATLLQLDRPAVRMSSKHEVAFIFTPHDGSESPTSGRKGAPSRIRGTASPS